MFNNYVIIAIVFAVIAGAGTIYWRGAHDQSNHQATEQLKHNNELGRKDAKIDKETPFDADKRATLDWLYQHGGRE